MASRPAPSAELPGGGRPLLIGLTFGASIAVTTTLVSGLVLVGTRGVLFDNVRQQLRQTAETAAALIDGDLHATFTRPEQESSADYAVAVRPLQAVLRSNPAIRIAYTGRIAGDSMEYVLDGSPRGSGVTGTPKHATIGQGAWATPSLKSAWAERRTLVDDAAVPTPWGPGVRATAPIFSRDGQITGFVAITLSLERYQAWTGSLDRIVLAGFLGGVLLALVAGYAAFRVERSRLRGEAELTAAKATAEASARTKGEFLANMSHEIRTPLHGVLGMSEALLASPHTEADRRSLEVINKSAASLLGILNDILDYSKLEAGRVELVNAPFDPRALVDDVTDLFAVTAEEHGLEIAVRETIRAERAPVGDGARLKQVLLNLVGNAVKFTEQGHVLVELETIMIGRQTVALRVSVSDTGIGIPVDAQAKLFEQFAQAEASTSRRFGGTGLGLAISRQLVLLMGGTLSVKSNVGSGTEFSVYLQLPASPFAREIPLAPRLPPGSRALVCCALPLSRQAIVEMMGRQGVTADSCDSPAVLLTRIRAGGSWVMALVDAPAEGTSAPPLFAGIANAPPLVLLTTLRQPLNNSSLTAAGAVAQLRRPVREDHLDQLFAGLASGKIVAAVPPPYQPMPAEPTSGVIPTPVQQVILAAKAGMVEPISAPGKPRVLVVDDVELNLMVARAMLSSLGVKVVTASSGRQALDMLAKDPVTLVFMDCHMPEIDGYDVTRSVRAAEGPNRKTPIVALTASAFADDRERAMACGMDDFAPKPIELGGLRAVLERWIPGYAPPAPSASAAAPTA